jgi:hypothetical protein
MPTHTLKLFCIAVFAAAIIVPSPFLRAQTVNFGSVKLTLYKDSSYLFVNSLPLSVDVTATVFLKHPSDYSIVTGGAPFTVGPNGSHAVTIRFAPTALGSRPDTLKVGGAFPGAPLIVTMQGTGIVFPVELQAFTARPFPGRIELRWSTASERGNVGFEVQRANSGSEDFAVVGFVAGNGTTMATQQYSFTDVPAGAIEQRYSYRLRQIDADGACEYSPVVTVASALPDALRLDLSVSPNPATVSTVFRFVLKEEARVQLTITDETGRIVSTIHDATLAPGSYALPAHVDGLPRGTYRATLSAGRERVSQLLVLQ